MQTETIVEKFNIELALLKALAIRKHYEAYIDYVVQDKLIEETRVFLDAYSHYYDLYKEHTEIDFSTLLTQFTANWHARDMHEDQLEYYSKAIATVRDAPSGDTETVLLGFINKQLIDRINTIAKKPFNTDSLRRELDNYEVIRAGVLKEYDPDLCKATDVDFTLIDKNGGIPYCHLPLQEALGGLALGSLVLYNAAFGIGKTAEIHEQLAHTLKWRKKVGETRPVLWINTEGTASEVWGRQWSNLFRNALPLGYTDILKKKDVVLSKFINHFGEDALYVCKGNKKGLNYIRTKIIKYNPCLVILDMAAAIIGQQGKNTSDTKSLEVYFDTLREFSSEYCPIIATVQAGNGAKWWDKDEHRWRYKQWPDSDDIYGSKSAIQGAAETIITIGRDDLHENTRYIRTTKLKAESDPVRFICEINKKYSAYDYIGKHNGGFGDA